MAKKSDETGADNAPAAPRKAALLSDCYAGAAGAVVELPAEEVDALVALGHADDNDAAVAHRESVAAGVAPAAEPVL